MAEEDYMRVDRLALLIALLLAGFACAAEPGQTIKLDLIASGAKRMFQPLYAIHEVKLDDEQPAGIKKLPPDLTAPQFAKLRIGPADSRTIFYVILEPPAGKPARLFVDANHNGDLTDDPACEWEARQTTVQTPSGLKDITSYCGGATVKVPYGSETLVLHVLLDYRPDKDDPTPGRGEDRLVYYQDFARAGKVTIDGKKYAALLFDPSGSGDYRDTKEFGGICLILDLNEDRKFDRDTEKLPINAPFNVTGTTYQISDMKASGASFRIVKSEQSVPQTQPRTPPNWLPFFAPGFQATTTDGKTINFPQDYHGKLVLLHFWSTGSKPSLAEIPTLVKAYDKYHAKNLEVVSINLDLDSSSESNKLKVAQSAKDRQMTWPQICDGNQWKGDIASKYPVRSIPAIMLIDGDTGSVLGFPDNLHSSDLDKTIQQELDRK